MYFRILILFSNNIKEYISMFMKDKQSSCYMYLYPIKLIIGIFQLCSVSTSSFIPDECLQWCLVATQSETFIEFSVVLYFTYVANIQPSDCTTFKRSVLCCNLDWTELLSKNIYIKCSNGRNLTCSLHNRGDG